MWDNAADRKHNTPVKITLFSSVVLIFVFESELVFSTTILTEVSRILFSVPVRLRSKSILGASTGTSFELLLLEVKVNVDELTGGDAIEFGIIEDVVGVVVAFSRSVPKGVLANVDAGSMVDDDIFELTF